MANHLFPREWEEAATVAGFVLGFQGGGFAQCQGLRRRQVLCQMLRCSLEEPSIPVGFFIPLNGLGIGSIGTARTDGLFSLFLFCVPGMP